MNEAPLLAADLHQRGYSYAELVQLTAAGELNRLRRGGYVRQVPEDLRVRHRQLIEASLPLLGQGAIVSHVSAAILHGLPTWDHDLDRVHVIRERDHGGRVGSVVHLHPMVLPTDEVRVIDGIAVTSLARTTADCIRTLPYSYGVAVGDAALRLGLLREDLQCVLRRRPRRIGNPTARRVADFIAIDAESVGESFSRVRIDEAGLPAPVLQYEIIDPWTGELVARSDFGWEEEKTVGEFDGKVKYGRLLKPGMSPGDAVFAEKVREDRIRDLGHGVVRWINADLAAFGPTAARIRRAMSRSRS